MKQELSFYLSPTRNESVGHSINHGSLWKLHTRLKEWINSSYCFSSVRKTDLQVFLLKRNDGMDLFFRGAFYHELTVSNRLEFWVLKESRDRIQKDVSLRPTALKFNLSHARYKLWVTQAIQVIFHRSFGFGSR